MPDISKGVELFNNNQYFEAHDYFEKLWKIAEPEEKLFLQGLIQISVGSYHLVNKNTKGALSQFTKGIQKLDQFRPVYCYLNIENIIEQIHRIVAILNSENSSGIDCVLPVIKCHK